MDTRFEPLKIILTTGKMRRVSGPTAFSKAGETVRHPERCLHVRRTNSVLDSKRSVCVFPSPPPRACEKLFCQRNFAPVFMRSVFSESIQDNDLVGAMEM